MGTLPQLAVFKGPTRELPFESYLQNLIGKMAQTDGKEVALIFDIEDGTTRKHTYDELQEISDKFAAYILDKIQCSGFQQDPAGISPDQDRIIAVHLPPSDYQIIVLLAIWKAGSTYLPIDPGFPQGRIDYILQDSKPILVIFDQEFSDHSNYAGIETVPLQKLLVMVVPEENRNTNYYNNTGNKNCIAKVPQGLTNHNNNSNTNEEIAIVLYTSGSTGVPKGVRLSHKTILNRLQWQFSTFPFGNRETVCISKTALTFVDSVAEIWGPLLCGKSLYVANSEVRKNPEKLLEILHNYQIQRLVLVPSLLKAILIHLKTQKVLGSTTNPLEDLKLWICSGEVLTKALVEEFYENFQCYIYTLCNFYGSTEVMGDVTFYPIQTFEEIHYYDSVPIGNPVDNTTLYILNPESLEPVKIGESGELFVSGRNLASGYVQNRDKGTKFLTAPFDKNEKLFRTGDFARILHGTVFYQGRTDSQIKIRGQRVDLSEIDSILNRYQCIDKAVVLCYKPGDLNQELLAFVRPKCSSKELDSKRLQNLLRNKLSSYMLPKIVFIEQIPLLVNGKVDQQKLLEQYERQRTDSNNNNFSSRFDYSSVDVEHVKVAKVLFEIVSTVLGSSLESVLSISSNFYEIGGNSLNSIVVITKLAQNGYMISISDFIKAKNFGEILRKLTASAKDEEPVEYQIESLRMDHKELVIEIITRSFYEKADLEQWLLPDIKESDYTELMEELWTPLIEKNLSFIVRQMETDRIVAVALNFDAYDEPPVHITSKLNIIFDFLESLEGPVRESMLPKGKGLILHSFMMGTHWTLKSGENVALMDRMEDEILKLAGRRNFTGILTTNTSPLTQQLGRDVYGYEILLDYQVNQYIYQDGMRPFGRAPDSQRALVHWRALPKKNHG